MFTDADVAVVGSDTIGDAEEGELKTDLEEGQELSDDALWEAINEAEHTERVGQVTDEMEDLQIGEAVKEGDEMEIDQ